MSDFIVEILDEDSAVSTVEILTMGPQGPPGQDGVDGQDGQDGPPGADGQDGAQGPPGETPDVSGFLVINIWDDDEESYPARPEATVVRYIGPEEPTDWTGYDEWREVAAVVTTTEPEAIVTLSATGGDGQATVTWVAPADGGSAITGYVITPIISGVAQTPTSVGVILSTIITGLVNGTTYTFTVSAVNGIGTGPPSAPSNTVTPASVSYQTPAQVQKAQNTAITQTTVTTTLGSTPTSGNLLVAVHSVVQTSVAANVTPPAGWTLAKAQSYGSSSRNRLAVYYKVAGGSESTSVTFTDATAGSHTLEIFEYSGTSGTVDVTSGASITSGSATTATCGPTSATAIAKELAVAVIALDGSSATWASSWTNSYVVQHTVPLRQRTAIKVLSAAGAQTTAEAWTSARMWAAVLVTFRAAT